MIWKVYKSSWLATFVSIVGAACIYGGIICLFSGQILPAVICVVIGIAFYLLAEKIAALRGGSQAGAAQKTAPAANRKTASGNKASGASNRTSRCAACGAALSPGSQFCAACGRKVQQARSCPMCGNRLAEGAKFCSSCGYQL